MVIKEWFENKMVSELHGGFLVEINHIEKETEKAYLLNITWGYTSSCEREISKWVPKSAIMTKEEHLAEIEKEVQKATKGLEYNQVLLTFAKENGVKGVRKGMKTSTLIEKIEKSNLEVPKRV